MIILLDKVSKKLSDDMWFKLGEMRVVSSRSLCFCMMWENIYHQQGWDRGDDEIS